MSQHVCLKMDFYKRRWAHYWSSLSSIEVIILGLFLWKIRLKKLEVQKEEWRKKKIAQTPLPFFFFYLALPAASFLHWAALAVGHFDSLLLFAHWLWWDAVWEKKKKKKPVAHFTPVCGASEGLTQKQHNPVRELRGDLGNVYVGARGPAPRMRAPL